MPPTNKDPIFLNSVTSKNATFVPGDGTTLKTMFTAGADGGSVLKLSATSSDVSAIVVKLTLNDGTDSVLIGEVTVPIGAGTNGSTPAKNLLDELTMPGMFQADGSLILGPLAYLAVSAKAALGAGAMTVSAQGGSYSV